MKKMLFALAALAAFTGSASAADLPARMPMKAAPPPLPVASWTGCYVAGGGGYGMWNQENTEFTDIPRVQTTYTKTDGGRGYFGTVQGGCDYQFGLGSWKLVVGGFGDYDFSDIHGNNNGYAGFGSGLLGNEKLSSTWAVGGRVGVLITPSLLTYFSGGYTEARFDRVNYSQWLVGFPNPGVYMDGRTYRGYFLGAGDEYALSFAPGLFWKTEYRVSEFDTRTDPFRITATGATFNQLDQSKKWVQTIRSELVYRFNWGGPVVAKY
jgi:outer membrane immunogenic protein